MAPDAERLAAEVGSLLFTHSSRTRFVASFKCVVVPLHRLPADTLRVGLIQVLDRHSRVLRWPIVVGTLMHAY